MHYIYSHIFLFVTSYFQQTDIFKHLHLLLSNLQSGSIQAQFPLQEPKWGLWVSLNGLAAPPTCRTEVNHKPCPQKAALGWSSDRNNRLVTDTTNSPSRRKKQNQLHFALLLMMWRERILLWSLKMTQAV